MRREKKVKKREKKEKVNSKSKILILILCILLFIACGLLGYFYYVYNNLKEDNTNIKSEIAMMVDEINNSNQYYVTYTDELSSKKEELKDKIEEYNIWLETIEKVK